jgi:xylulokinase
MALLLGIDVGTSTVKALVLDSKTSTIVAVSTQEYPIYTPKNGYAEQICEDYWQATIKAVRAVAHPEIAAIGFSGQMHGTILLDEYHHPIQNAIIWADARSAEQTQILSQIPNYASITGTKPATGFMMTTLLWILQHKPDLLRQATCVLLPKDYVRFRMTNEPATDISDAAGTGVFDVRNGHWAYGLIEQTGLPQHIFPRVVASGAIVGRLLPDIALELGLTADIPVIAGCADQPAQAIGNGLIKPGMASVTVGTGGQVFVPTTTFKTDERLHVFNHAVPNMWYTLGAILSAGLSLRWLRNTLGLGYHPNAYQILSDAASQTPAGADGLLFLPYLSGERTPHFDPSARGVFIGLAFHHERGHLARAVIEGVSFALRQTLELCLASAGHVDRIIMSGGGAESDVWRQILADISGLPLQKSLLKEQACVGAAVLAGMSINAYSSFEHASGLLVQYDNVTKPNMERHARYQEMYQAFIELYPKVSDTMHFLSKYKVTPS